MTRSAATVESRLRRLDRAACGAFVADLWAARGYETVREDGVVVATRDGESITLYPVGSALFGFVSAPDRSIDAVVAPGGGRAAATLAARRDATVLDAGDLRELLWYAVDRPVATALCERHLGAPPADLRPPLRARARERGSNVEIPASAASVVSLVAVLGGLALLAGVGLTGMSGPPIDPGVGPGSDAPDTPPDTSPDTPPGARERAGGTDPGASAATATPVPTVVRAPVPVPGVTRDGIENLTALAAAHRRTVGARSYTLWIDIYRPRGGRPNATRIKRDVDIAVAGGQYRLAATIEGEVGSRTVREVYHDGTDWYVADGVGRSRSYRRVSFEGRARFDNRPSAIGPDPIELRRTLVVRYLATPETTVSGRVTEDRRLRYRVVGHGSPPALEGVRNYSAVALIDERGLVRDLTVEYTVVTDDGTYDRRFEATYGRFDRTRVNAPDWFRREFPGNGTRSAGSDA